MKKALVITIANNYSGDYKAFIKGLELANFEVKICFIDELSECIDNMNIKEFDLILFQPLSNSLWNSGKKRGKTFEILAKEAKPGALSAMLVDITFPVDPYIWDKGETSKEKRNVLNIVPMKILASFSEEILQDEKALERINKIWLQHFHKDSQFIPIEWLTFYYSLNTQNKKKKKNLLFDLKEKKNRYRNFYYGIEKKKLKDSLIKMGMESKEDLAYGLCGNMLQHCTTTPNKKDWQDWIPFVDNIIVPYEPIKGDYQVNFRHLEALRLYPDKIKADPRLSKDIQDCLKSENVWKKKQEETIKKLKELY